MSEEKKEEIKAEAAEVKEEIKETKEEAAEARAEGDAAAAERLEKRVEGLEDTLKGLGAKLDALISRPFHPAPGEKEDPDEKGRTGNGAVEKDAAAEETSAEEKKPKGRTVSRGWFGARAEEE